MKRLGIASFAILVLAAGCTGPRVAVTVPSVIGLDAPIASQRIVSASLNPVFVPGPVASAPDYVNTVAAQHPAPGTSLWNGSRVKVILYTDPAAMVVVPAATDMPMPTAMMVVRNAGLNPAPLIVGAAPSRNMFDVVYTQHPPAGATVPLGSTVQLTAYAAYLAPDMGPIPQKPPPPVKTPPKPPRRGSGGGSATGSW